ncbi:LysR family transcriptional regulator [Burkholderia gladioli]|uniref:LysR family transcriptional regulator n=1 Tax=Burkholderia gladioli TaxID=28095 RepID=UPI0015603673|nr:LysR family transcriptional regulator [Burkholderia gladioli]MCA8170202.1 LysR family transcriptional regulator [Burkholderia gladioli]MDN7750959.1 LysR family transcriptional regulator [Burkholderia gladioli]NRF87299.1 LysR family transcriptional regulator [Burkholderia gladioli]
MNVELNHLRCFIAVAEELHFGRAAARLFMTQPPLSRQIQLLEESLGLQLFERNSRSVKLTDAGRAYYQDALRILRLTEQAADAARRVARGDAGQVAIGFTAVAGYRLVPDLLAAAREQLPGIRLVLKEMVSVAQLEALKTRAIDLGILRAQSPDPQIGIELLAREPLLAVLPAAHRLVARDTIAAADLAGEPFVMYSADGGRYFHDRIVALLTAAGVHVDVAQQLDQTHTVLTLVRAGIGVSIVPASARELGMRDVVFRPLWTQEATADLDLGWRVERDSPAVERFRAFALGYFAGLGGVRTTTDQ